MFLKRKHSVRCYTWIFRVEIIFYLLTQSVFHVLKCLYSGESELDHQYRLISVYLFRAWMLSVQVKELRCQYEGRPLFSIFFLFFYIDCTHYVRVVDSARAIRFFLPFFPLFLLFLYYYYSFLILTLGMFVSYTSALRRFIYFSNDYPLPDSVLTAASQQQ